ncbi:MAG TPA: ABC transporter permease [Armatimonadota bacterium]|jgi:hypothetical protein
MANANELNVIRDQVKLPLSVAFEVAMQGIRIRFGRSIVTATGVVLGVAFLMSILSGQVIKTGVSKEADLRTETKRMYSFLSSEMGPPKNRVAGVIQVGALSDAEARLIATLLDNGLQKVNWSQAAGTQGTAPALGQVGATVSPDQAGAGADALLILGQGSLPQLDWAQVTAGMRQPVLALGQSYDQAALPKSLSVVNLARELKPEEIEAQKLEKRQAAFRSLWMTIISLLVTFICISNSLLMSVTERFKEIGTMKCLGALSGFIRQLFLIESSLIGLVGALVGSLVGLLFSVLGYGLLFGFGLVFTSMNWGLVLFYILPCLAVGVVLSIIAALYPASFAASMVPGTALRSNI